MNQTTDPKYKVKTSKTVFTILEYLLDEDGARPSAVADDLELSVSTAHNHLKTLEALGYVAMEDGEYYPSLRFLRFGSYVNNRKDEYDMVREKLDELAEETQERVQFIVAENDLGVCLASAEGRHAILTQPTVGMQIYLHASAAGKAILSQLSRKAVESVIDSWGLPAVTEHTITDEDDLFAELEDIRQQDYALNYQENRRGTHAVGISINYPSGDVLGGLSVIGPTHRIKNGVLEDDLPALLLGLKNELELNIEHTIQEA